MTTTLFSPFILGPLTLKNRMVMAPLTRCRAQAQGVVGAMQATYYRQRAEAGLLITEATSISAQGTGYVFVPGIYTDAQIEAWKAVTNAVHEEKGLIFLQLWHVGRISHPDLQVDAALPVAPSAIKPEGQVFTGQVYKDYVTPRALATDELPGVVEQYTHAAIAAKKAGFDGVEVHCANGYLLDQFIRDGSNIRTDAYGGSIENRIRLPLEVIRAVSAIWGAERVGVRISPMNSVHSMQDSEPFKTFKTFVEHLNPLGLAYLHCVEGAPMVETTTVAFDYEGLRKAFNGPYMANGGYDKARAMQAIEQGQADLISFGRPFIGNPDLVRRFKANLPLTNAPRNTWYAKGEKGYIDWPMADKT